MKNSERHQQALALAKKALRHVWPDEVIVKPTGWDNGEMKYTVLLGMHIDGQEPKFQERKDYTIAELFQLVAGILKDYKPDVYEVFDTEKKQVAVIDAVDFTEDELMNRFAPLPERKDDEKYEVRFVDEEHVVFKVRGKTGEIISRPQLS
jgi:hypothetical protein